MAGKENNDFYEQILPSSYTVLSCELNRKRDSVKLSLSSDETLILPCEKYAHARLKEGSVISRDELLSLKMIEAGHKARQRALSLLEKRDFTVAQLKRKLSEALYEKEVIAAVIKELSARGYLNDEKYAEAWIAFQLRRKPQGRRLLFNGLRRKGISREQAERLMMKAYPVSREEEMCEMLLRKTAARRRLSTSELFSYMARRGFSPSLIKKLLNKKKWVGEG